MSAIFVRDKLFLRFDDDSDEHVQNAKITHEEELNVEQHPETMLRIY